MTTISGSFAIDPAARIKCSSSERFIDPPALLISQDPRKWGGLPYPRTIFTWLRDERCNVLPWSFQHFLPLLEPRWRRILPTKTPSLDVSVGNCEQARVALDFPRNDRVHRQAACLD